MTMRSLVNVLDAAGWPVHCAACTGRVQGHEDGARLQIAGRVDPDGRLLRPGSTRAVFAGACTWDYGTLESGGKRRFRTRRKKKRIAAT